jgi:O-antigen/teichoic acid export membrane protein
VTATLRTGPLPALSRRLLALWGDSSARGSLLVFANNLVAAAGGMLFWLICTRRFTPELVGLGSAGTALVILLASIGQLGLGMGLIRHGERLGPRRARRILGIFALVGATALLAGMLFALLAPAVAPGMAPALAGRYDGALLAASCAGWALAVQHDNYLLGRRLTGLLALKGLATAALRPLLLLCLASPTPAQLIALTGLSGALGVFLIMPFVPRYSGAAAHGAPPVGDLELLRFSLWNFVSGLAGTLPSLLVPAIIVGVAGAVTAGVYAMAWTLFSALLFAPSAVAWVRFAEGSAGERPAGQLRGAAPLMALLLLLFIPSALLALALLGEGYLRGGWPLLLLLAAGFWPYYRAQLLGAAIRVHGTQWKLAAAIAASHLAIVAATPPLLRLLGAPGAALAWSAGQLLCSAALWAARDRRGAGGPAHG